ncbi:MAG: alpha/beta hydrolase family esterase [Marinifilaceae bacterium]
MKKYLLTLLLPMLIVASCAEDNSAYLPQEKEEVVVDKVIIEDDNGNDIPSDGSLVPGIHLAKVNIEQPDGNIVERRFKYFVPISLDPAKPISLIFEFHGSWTYNTEIAPDPLEGITSTHSWAQLALKENCVVVFPAGEATGKAVNWQNSEKHLPFVDCMVNYFLNTKPAITKDRIYSSGQSSGAIFSFVLAFERSEVFAAIAPRAGQMKIADNATLPTRAVPIRLFAGEDDDTVLHSAALANMTAWAEKIGGYFPKNMDYTPKAFTIEGYADVDTRIWHGARSDIEMYTLKKIGHGINLGNCIQYIWEFWENHTLQQIEEPLFISVQNDSIIAQCTQPISIPFMLTQGATPILENCPPSWNVTIKDNVITMQAPSNYFGNIERKGTFKAVAEKAGEKVEQTIYYELLPPKTYYEIGDIYYNEKFEPIGVVYYVNQEDIRNAKIIAIEKASLSNKFGTYGDFYTPDMDNGKENTRLLVERNNNEKLGLTASTSAAIWCHEYNFKGVTNWFLPAANEWLQINNNLNVINAAIKSVGGIEISSTNLAGGWHHTSTTKQNNEGNKVFVQYNVYSHALSESVANNDNTAYAAVRAATEVTIK